VLGLTADVARPGAPPQARGSVRALSPVSSAHLEDSDWRLRVPASFPRRLVISSRVRDTLANQEMGARRTRRAGRPAPRG
jgi:hypothetical protein